MHNLDSVSESFEFVLKGHTYKFRHLTTEEIQELGKLKDEAKLTEYLYQFITPSSENAPEFSELAKNMIAPQWSMFRKMIQSEMGIDASN